MTSKGEFTTPYSMCIVDLCPVGALTSKDFRFESRVWFMDFTDSVCTGCARGCNVTMGTRGGRFLRMAPRENQAVNRWWMCDAGRLGYKFVNSATRVASARVRTGADVWREVSLEEGITAAARALSEARGGVLADAGLTLEELFLLRDLAKRRGGPARFASAVGKDGDDLLIVNEKGANRAGAEALGYERATAAFPAAVLAVERDANVPKALRDGCGAVVVLATDLAHVPESARVVLPLPSWAEKDGLVVNVDGIVQETRRARSAGPQGLLPTIDLLEEVILEMDPDAEPLGRAGILDALRALPAFAGKAFPEVEAAPQSARTVAAPPGRTR